MFPRNSECLEMKQNLPKIKQIFLLIHSYGRVCSSLSMNSPHMCHRARQSSYYRTCILVDIVSIH